MSVKLYKLVEGKIESEKVEATDVERLLESGYSTTEKSLLKPVRKTKAKKEEWA